jgi:hypothetical protein
VYDKIEVDNPVDMVYPLIDYEVYWQKACEKHFTGSDCTNHGNSWKQCYAENFIQNLVSNFDIEKGDTLENELKYFEIMKFEIFNLDIPTFSSDFDISKIPTYFINLTSLSLKYSPILIDQNKKDILTTVLERKYIFIYTAIKEEYTRFGMRMIDLKQFSLALGELNYLLNLTLQGNFIDDEMVDWLVPGLITNHTLRNLDLSNNKITDKG